VKENSLLKKYLDEANTDKNSYSMTSGVFSAGANEEALKLSFMNQNTQRENLNNQGLELKKSGIQI
jgi:hypothetical protein